MEQEVRARQVEQEEVKAKVMANFEKQLTRMEDIQHKKEQVSSQSEVKL